MLIKDKELFLKYAIPCGRVLVNRGTLEKKTLQNLYTKVLNKKEPKTDLSECFPVATKMCEILAKEMGKPFIDKEVIEKYFLFEHKKAVERRVKLFQDIPEECVVHPGKVLQVNKDQILVNTPLGERIIRNDFLPEIRRNDWISIHYDYAIQKLPTERARRILNWLRK